MSKSTRTALAEASAMIASIACGASPVLFM